MINHWFCHAREEEKRGSERKHWNKVREKDTELKGSRERDIIRKKGFLKREDKKKKEKNGLKM